MNSESLKEVAQHQRDLEKLFGLDVDIETAIELCPAIIHLNHRFFKTFFPEEEDSFFDVIPFSYYTNFDCWKLLGESLVEF